MATVDHKAITGSDAVHPCDFYQSGDPGAVGPNKTWKDTTTTPPIQKRRNAADSGWDTVFDPGNYQVKSLLTTLGDSLYASGASTWARLAGNITTNRKFLRQVGDGANSAAPAWDTLQAADLAAHVLATNVALGAQHTISGAAAGQVLRASGAAAANFQALAAGDIPNLPASIITSGQLGASHVAGIEPTYYMAHVNGGGGLDLWYPLGAVTANGGGTGVIIADTLYAVPFVAPGRGATLDRIGFNVSTLAAGNARAGIYTSTSDTNLYPSDLVVDGGSISTGTTGAKTSVISQALVPGKLYWAVLVANATPTMRSWINGVSSAILGVDSNLANAWVRGLTVSFTFAALPATFPASAALSTTAGAVLPLVFGRYSA